MMPRILMIAIATALPLQAAAKAACFYAYLFLLPVNGSIYSFIVIWSNSRHGYIDEDGCDNICTDLDDALEKAYSRIERGQYDRALLEELDQVEREAGKR